jgi:carbonic anhydrase
MRKLIEGIIEFRRKISEEHRELFARLALGQRPDTLFIACSDSRVVPHQFASTNPGDLFVLRNVGNLIPPDSTDPQDVSAQATLEFSLFSLPISDIVVCGHSECGAIQALVHGHDAKSCPHLASWLKHGEASLKKGSEEQFDPKLSLENRISQANVLQQMEHISSYGFIQERLRNKTLRLHGWWFDIAHADVYCYEAGRFVLIDEQEAALILKRLG